MESMVPDDDGFALADREARDGSEAVREIRASSDRIRRRELETAYRRLEARGELTAEDRLRVARLSVRITDALVERWVSKLADGRVAADERVDPEAVRSLFVGEE